LAKKSGSRKFAESHHTRCKIESYANACSQQLSWNLFEIPRKVLAVKSAITLAAVMTLLALSALGQTTPGWKVFVNRGGWSISYPADWRIDSCKNCKDPQEPGVYVDFFPPKERPPDGRVMVESLGDKPSDTSADAWLADVSKTANLNQHVHEQKLTLNGLPALKVHYCTDYGLEMEAVYVVSGSETFEIYFGGDQSGLPLEKFGNYATYVKMLGTFRAKPR